MSSTTTMGWLEGMLENRSTTGTPWLVLPCMVVTCFYILSEAVVFCQGVGWVYHLASGCLHMMGCRFPELHIHRPVIHCRLTSSEDCVYIAHWIIFTLLYVADLAVARLIIFYWWLLTTTENFLLNMVTQGDLRCATGKHQTRLGKLWNECHRIC